MKKVKIAVLTLLITISAFAVLSSNVEYSSGALNKFRSYEELKEFLHEQRLSPYRGLLSDSSGLMPSESTYSQTNVQVEGVDEADTIKTDGEYIYTITNQKVIITRAYPAEEARVLSWILINGTPKELFLNKDRLVVFYENGSWSETKTFISVYDVSDRENPTPTREVAADGVYRSSRMIGDYVYVLVGESAWPVNDEVNLPQIYSNGNRKAVFATDVYYSDIVDYGYAFTTIVTVNVQEDAEEPTYCPILSGITTNIYVSHENIYLAMSDADKTFLHRIHIENNQVSPIADGEVQGRVLNQFSMDEYEGYFRIATTSQTYDLPRQSRFLALQNNVYTLNMDLEVVGKLENITPGEQIHSARFMGKRCYLVTFRKVDPFFVIDLSNPYNPEILGELKITGFSDYLHPYDETHVIGVGKETVSAEEGDFSWYQGVKVSLFDVADVSNPKELAKYEIGDRGTDSPVLSDHKAFLFDREKSLLAMPVSVAKINESEYPNGVPPYAYGELVWQGAYVFTVSLDSPEKITLKGAITHVENSDVYDSSYHITRVLYIGEVLYTISNSKIKMNSLSDLNEINELNLKE